MSDDATKVRDDGESRAREAGRALLGVVAILAVCVVLGAVGVPFDTSYRICCAAGCLWLIRSFQAALPNERWPRITLWAAALVNVGIFFTPLVDHPSSRGEVMVFAIPDVVVGLIVMIATLRPVDVNQRAKRVQLIVMLIFACLICGALVWAAVAESRHVL